MYHWLWRRSLEYTCPVVLHSIAILRDLAGVGEGRLRTLRPKPNAHSRLHADRNSITHTQGLYLACLFARVAATTLPRAVVAIAFTCNVGLISFTTYQIFSSNKRHMSIEKIYYIITYNAIKSSYRKKNEPLFSPLFSIRKKFFL